MNTCMGSLGLSGTSQTLGIQDLSVCVCVYVRVCWGIVEVVKDSVLS